MTCQKIYVPKYACLLNDTIMYLTVHSDTTVDALQTDLDQLGDWEQTWKMIFHPAKCQVITLTRSRRKTYKREYTPHGHVLESVDSVKYIGCTITSDLNWGKHIRNICGKASNTIGFLKRNLNISFPPIKEKEYKAEVCSLCLGSSSKKR